MGNKRDQGFLGDVRHFTRTANALSGAARSVTRAEQAFVGVGASTVKLGSQYRAESDVYASLEAHSEGKLSRALLAAHREEDRLYAYDAATGRLATEPYPPNYGQSGAYTSPPTAQPSIIWNQPSGQAPQNTSPLDVAEALNQVAQARTRPDIEQAADRYLQALNKLPHAVDGTIPLLTTHLQVGGHAVVIPEGVYTADLLTQQLASQIVGTPGANVLVQAVRQRSNDLAQQQISQQTLGASSTGVAAPVPQVKAEPLATPTPAPAPTPAAASPSLPLAEAQGADARHYDNAHIPPIAANQVADVQRALLAAYGAKDLATAKHPDGVDGKWGKNTQRVFEQACKDAHVAPQDVDFKNPDTADTEKLLASLKQKRDERQKAAAPVPKPAAPEPAAPEPTAMPTKAAPSLAVSSLAELSFESTPQASGLGRYDPSETSQLPEFGKHSRHQLAEQGLKEIGGYGWDSFMQDTDGQAGTRSTAAIKKFEREHGLKVDGIADPAMLAALGQAVAEKNGLNESGVRYSNQGSYVVGQLTAQAGTGMQQQLAKEGAPGL